MTTTSAWWQLHGELAQQGPGCDASTLQALRALGPIPQSPHILDMGCGPGRQSVALAGATAGTVVGLDLLLPFLRQLDLRSRERGLSDRIQTVCADMNHPPIAAGQFDLLWSEGAIYIPGFEAGLTRWRELLRDGGLAAVSELSWVAEPPTETRAFWEAAYPAVANVETNRDRAERAGYEVMSTFGLPLADWHAYYDPIERRAIDLRRNYEDDPAALAILSGHREEMQILDASDGSYTYVFYLLRKR
jgi:serine/threonine-protein kinase HipA